VCACLPLKYDTTLNQKYLCAIEQIFVDKSHKHSTGKVIYC